jgi:Cu/Ag efflux pump CusA
VRRDHEALPVGYRVEYGGTVPALPEARDRLLIVVPLALR